MRLFTALLFFTISLSSFAQGPKLYLKGSYPHLYLTHAVQKGETYKSIGSLYNIAPEALANYNDLNFYDGQVFAKILNVPLSTQNLDQGLKSNTPGTGIPLFYVVQNKVPIAIVGKRFNLSTAAIKQWNS